MSHSPPVSAVTPQADSAPNEATGRGFVLGELLVAALLLVVAISSLTALMYTVTRNPRAPASAECTATSGAGSAKCEVMKPKASPAASKLLVSGCATRTGSRVQTCKDSVLLASSEEGTIIKSRTDSASLALLPKKSSKRAKRPDLGFIR
ncbi:MAG TPA: hypothetical protein VNO75_06310 [Gemmatimonadaceae bacterium]|nr:hypothetical protein [Gemmatimonadaceae bacterium]